MRNICVVVVVLFARMIDTKCARVRGFGFTASSETGGASIYFFKMEAETYRTCVDGTSNIYQAKTEQKSAKETNAQDMI